jgi:hypothetical protein
LALKALPIEDANKLNSTNADQLLILKEVTAIVESKKQNCLQRRWKYVNSKGNVVKLRDLFEKIATWMNKFKEIGDVAVQFDPVHASLPWAGVRFLLQVAVNDAQTFGAMAEGVEFISNRITRYAIIEELYMRQDSTARHHLKQAIIKLYTAILQYLFKAKHYYERSTAGTIISLTISSVLH